MALSGFAHSAKSEASKGSPWVWDWTPGPALANLFNLYPTKGNVTISGATNLPSLLDGPMIVARYGALTVNQGLSVVNRCRGLLILCDSLTMGATGSITMTGKGPVGSAYWANQDIVLPTSGVRLWGKNTSYKDFMAWLAATGYAVIDPTLFACPPPGMGDVQANYGSWPGNGTAIISASGCGTGGDAVIAGVGAGCATQHNGNPGNAGVNAPGGGSSAGAYSAVGYALSGAAGPGHVWGGGVGSSYAVTAFTPTADQYSAVNAGAPVIVICRGAVSIAAGATIQSDAVPQGNYTGQPGGGFAGLFYDGTKSYSNAGTVRAAGAAGTGSPSGGNSGNGSVAIKTFAQMGWS